MNKMNEFFQEMMTVEQDNKHQYDFYNDLRDVLLQVIDCEAPILIGKLVQKYGIYIKENERFAEKLAEVANNCDDIIASKQFQKKSGKMFLLDYAFTEIKPFDKEICAYPQRKELLEMLENMCLSIEHRCDEIRELEDICDGDEELKYDLNMYFEDTRNRCIGYSEEDENLEENEEKVNIYLTQDEMPYFMQHMDDILNDRF